MGIKSTRVEHMLSSRSGRGVVNQFLLYTPAGVYFQSYESIIALKCFDGVILLDEYYWDYSVTTGKYRNIFLGENKRETRKKIENGTYILSNLN